MLKIDITEGKPNRFGQAATILGVIGTLRGLGLCVLSELDGEVEVRKALYEVLEADIAAVGSQFAKNWLRAYGVGKKPHCLDDKVMAHPLQEAFDAVIAQVTTGKGQRHGGGEQPFFEQPWYTTTQQVGIGFPLGQAMKKLGESSSKPDVESFETELLGAIAYAAMAYIANKKLVGKS